MIVVFLPYGIGDVIMAIPGLKRICKIFEPKEITVIIASKVQLEVLEKLIEYPIQVIIYNQNTTFGSIKLYFQILSLNPQFIYAPLINTFKSRILFFIFLFKKTFVPSKVVKSRFLNLYPFEFSFENYKGHQVNYLINFFNLGHGKINTDDASPNEFNDSRNRVGMSRLPASKFQIIVGISCGEAERHKVSSTIVFAHLLNELSNKLACDFILIGNQSDIELINKLVASFNDNVSYKIKIYDSIKETLDDMSQFDLGISGTTGQGHMMSVVDLPVLILSGVTDPRESGPYVSRAAIVKHDFSCGPCYQATFKYGCKKISCMDAIDVNLAVEQTVKLLQDEKFGLNWLKDEERKVPTSIFQIQQFLKSQGIQYP